MGSSELTSRYTAHTIDGTVLVPAGVDVTRPLVGEMLPDVDEPALPADRPHAAASSAHAATAAVMAPILLVAPIGSSSGPARHYWMPALSAVSIRLPFKPPHP